MKYLIIIFVPSFLYATSWINESELAKCHNNIPHDEYVLNQTGMYKTQDCKIESIQDVQVDDPEKPIYAARTNETDCVVTECQDYTCDKPENDCSVLTAITCDYDSDLKPINCTCKLCSDSSYYALYADKKDFGLGEGYFAYCTKLLGFEQKTVKKLVLDPALKAAKDAKVAMEKKVASLFEKENKKDKSNKYKQVLKDPSLTQAEKNYVQALIDILDVE